MSVIFMVFYCMECETKSAVLTRTKSTLFFICQLKSALFLIYHLKSDAKARPVLAGFTFFFEYKLLIIVLLQTGRTQIINEEPLQALYKQCTILNSIGRRTKQKKTL